MANHINSSHPNIQLSLMELNHPMFHLGVQRKESSDHHHLPNKLILIEIHHIFLLTAIYKSNDLRMMIGSKVIPKSYC
jgi:hypothetical protein